MDDWGVKESSHFTNVKDKAKAFLGADEISQVLLEHISPQSYSLSYTCLIIPRFKSHYLVGDLAVSLYDQMNRIRVSFGWRLEFIDIRAEYLQ